MIECHSASKYLFFTGFFDNDPNYSVNVDLGGGSSFALNEWIHYCVIRSGRSIYGFRNGVLTDSAIDEILIENEEMKGQPTITSPMRMGADTSGYGNNFKGYIDNFRFTKEVRYDLAGFTPPANDEPLDDTPGTVVLGDTDKNTQIDGITTTITGNTVIDGRLYYERSVLEVSVNYVLSASNDVLLVNGTYTATLPTAAGITGKVFTIKNIGTGVVTVDGDGSETIDSSTTVTLDPEEAIKVVSDGTEWWII